MSTPEAASQGSGAYVGVDEGISKSGHPLQVCAPVSIWGSTQATVARGLGGSRYSTTQENQYLPP